MVADIFDPKKRSEIMSRIRGKNTKPELVVFRYLRKRKIYFQKHYRSQQGIVLDVALPRKKKAIFIDGDFWHGRTLEAVRERRGEEDFWTRKILRSIERDEQQRRRLEGAGWQILNVWESELMRKSTQTEILEKIERFMKNEGHFYDLS